MIGFQDTHLSVDTQEKYFEAASVKLCCIKLHLFMIGMLPYKCIRFYCYNTFNYKNVQMTIMMQNYEKGSENDT